MVTGKAPLIMQQPLSMHIAVPGDKQQWNVSSCNTWYGGTGDGDSEMTAADIASEVPPTTSTAPPPPLLHPTHYGFISTILINREKELFTDKYNS